VADVVGDVVVPPAVVAPLVDVPVRMDLPRYASVRPTARTGCTSAGPDLPRRWPHTLSSPERVFMPSSHCCPRQSSRRLPVRPTTKLVVSARHFPSVGAKSHRRLPNPCARAVAAFGPEWQSSTAGIWELGRLRARCSALGFGPEAVADRRLGADVGGARGVRLDLAA
jgi:hypothetical protein